MSLIQRGEFGAVPTAPTIGFPGEITDQLDEIASYVFIGNGSPEGAVAAPQGSVYFRRDGASTSSQYFKEDGDTGNTGWVPARLVVTLSNLLANPGFETDTSSWTTSNNTLTRQTSGPTPGIYQGTAVGRMAASSAADMYIESESINVVAGGEYTARTAANTAVTSRSVRLDILWYNSAGTLISTSTGAANSDVVDEWIGYFYATATAPSTAETAKIRFYVLSPANAEQHYVDALYFSRTNPAIISDFATGLSPHARLEASDSAGPYIRMYVGADNETYGLIWHTISSAGASANRTTTLLSSGKLDAGDKEVRLQLQSSGSGGLTSLLGVDESAGGAISGVNLRSDAISWVNGSGTSIPFCALLGRASVRGGSDTSYSRNSATFAAIDTTNLRVAFVAPNSGKVIVKLNAVSWTDAGTPGRGFWRLQDSGGTVVASTQTISCDPTQVALVSYEVEVTGLTGGTTYTWDWAFASDATASTYIGKGPTFGAPRMEVWGILE